MTSHDVVDRVRKALQTRKVGHAGTLDPLATGVMVVCIGKATRLSGYLTCQSKRYTTRIRLGVETDTLDADGAVVRTSEDIPTSVDEIERAAQSFIGLIEQIPPMFSARKVNGQRLHRLARSGRTVHREPRQVEIHDLRVLGLERPFVDLDVKCSKGTYIRSLASGLGDVIGCGGSVEALRRTESGSISEDACIPLDEVTEATATQFSIDPNEALADIPGVVLTGDQAERFCHGNEVDLAREVPTPCRVNGEHGAFWGMGKSEEKGWLRPVCVLRDLERARETHPA